MLQLLGAYELAGLIHDSVWQRNELLSDEKLAASSLCRTLGHLTGTKQVFCEGTDNFTVEPIYETLGKGHTNGQYYFTATPGESYAGDLSMGRHVITPSNSEELAERFAKSLIAREFLRLAEAL